MIYPLRGVDFNEIYTKWTNSYQKYERNTRKSKKCYFDWILELIGCFEWFNRKVNPLTVPTTTKYLLSLHSLCRFNSIWWQPFCTKGTVPTTMNHVHTLPTFPAWVPTTTMCLHSLHFTAWFNSLHAWPSCNKGTILATMYLHSLCSFIVFSRMGFSSLHWSPPLPCPTFTAFHCVDSIPCMDDLFPMRELSPPPCTHIPSVLCMDSIVSWAPHHQYSLHFPVWSPCPV